MYRERQTASCIIQTFKPENSWYILHRANLYFSLTQERVGHVPHLLVDDNAH